MHKSLLILLASTSLLGAADPAVPLAPLVPDPPSTLCRANGGATSATDVAPATALLPGYGTGGFAIRTRNSEAQAWFDNGMQLAHAFAHDAAVAAFRRAVQVDPECAMCLWGEAWSGGPTINERIDADRAGRLAALADRAATLADDGPPKERELVAALRKRYHDGGGAGPGDLAYAAAMDDVARRHPDDDEIAVMTADAWMIPAAHGDHRDHLPRAVALLEDVLARHPDDSAAIHFYIHATEMSGVGADALPYAQRLQALAPAASHLVHMPSHVWYWTGRFDLAKRANVDAVALDEAEASRTRPADGAFGLRYHAHNVQFGIAGAMLDGDGAAALALAAPVVARPSIKRGDAWPQVVLGSAYFAYGRFADAATVEALPDPGDELPLARAAWRYAHGESAARRGDTAKLRAVAEQLARDRASLGDLGGFAGKALALVDIERLVLEGRLAMLEHRWPAAVASYRQAADLQRTALDEIADPPIWWYPVQRSLAAALLADGRTADAAQAARRVLVRWVGDPLSERILADVATVNGRDAEARDWLDAARGHWSGDPAALPFALL